MFCPRCLHEKTYVSGTVKGQTNQRFRKCPHCGYTFLTIEAICFDDYWKEYAYSSAKNDKCLPNPEEKS